MTDPDAPKREHTPSNSLAIEAIRRSPIVRIVLVVLPAIVSSIAAYTGATVDAEDRAAVVERKAVRAESKAGAGYQVTREAVQDLQEQVAQLRAELAALKRAVKAGSKTVVKPSAPAPAPAAPAPLPANLDRALEQAGKAPATELPKP